MIVKLALDINDTKPGIDFLFTTSWLESEYTMNSGSSRGR